MSSGGGRETISIDTSSAKAAASAFGVSYVFGGREVPGPQVPDVAEQLLGSAGMGVRPSASHHRVQMRHAEPYWTSVRTDLEPAMSSGSPAGPQIANAFAAFSGVQCRLQVISLRSMRFLALSVPFLECRERSEFYDLSG